MNGQGWSHLAARITSHACRCLPEPDRQEWYREWAAELPEFVTDPHAGPLPWRVVKMLLCAVDHHRGARRLARAAGYRKPVLIARLVDPALKVIGGALLFAAVACEGVSSEESTGWAVSGNSYMATTTPIPRNPGLAHLLSLVGGGALASALVAGLGWLALYWSRQRTHGPSTPRG
jgi:hypothetical protein